MITQAFLKELFDYKDGELYWKTQLGTKIKIRDRAGCLGPDGYYLTGIKGKKYLNHRIIYLWYYGVLPDYLDHIDQDKTNNRIENLRPASISQNGANQMKQRTRATKASNWKGVSWCKSHQKWQAQICIKGKSIHLGRFADEDTAASAYNLAAYEHFGEFASYNIAT